MFKHSIAMKIFFLCSNFGPQLIIVVKNISKTEIYNFLNPLRMHMVMQIDFHTCIYIWFGVNILEKLSDSCPCFRCWSWKALHLFKLFGLFTPLQTLRTFHTSSNSSHHATLQTSTCLQCDSLVNTVRYALYNLLCTEHTIQSIPSIVYVTQCTLFIPQSVWSNIYNVRHAPPAENLQEWIIGCWVHLWL